MPELKKIEPQEFDKPFLKLVAKDWLLLAAQHGGKTNAMTCSWGGMGFLWNKNVVFIFVRHSRYTYPLIEQAETFSLSFFDDPKHKLLTYFGTVSGRDENKIAKSGLTLTYREDTPCFAEARLTLTCRKLYAQDQLPELFLDSTILPNFYSGKNEGDYHRMYVGEILSITETIG